MKRLACVLWSGLFLGWAMAATAAEPARDPSRDVFLQTIGMLAGQGLVLGHEALEGIHARYEKGILPRENAERALADQARYADWVLAAFKDRLMGRLAEQEKKDLALLIGFYEVQRQAVEALASYVRAGGAKNRENFEAQQERVAAIIRQISLGGGAP
ncbi:MAG: hypothetical protein AAGU21_16365 [Solidesulfovibrio sp.]|uniref:hypothetical protein n=1 Tax=Solidesulfovibrio sp. TaxID=2910990 RepID=UPI003159825A